MEETDLAGPGDDDREPETRRGVSVSALPCRPAGVAPVCPGAVLQEPAETPAQPLPTSPLPPGAAEHSVLLVPGPAGGQGEVGLLLHPHLLPPQPEEFHFVTQNR